MKSILTIFKVLIILFWFGFFATIASFIFFGDQITAFLYTIPLLVQIKEVFGITRDTLETIVVFVIIVMLPFTILIFSLGSRLRSYKKKEKISKVKPIVEAKPLVSTVATPTITKPIPVKEIKKVELDYYELGLTGIKIKK
jgi:hypothetical protein